MDVEQPGKRQRFRGKLYALSDEAAWEDTGTGFVSIVGGGNDRRLVFRDEDTSEVLHDRPVFSADAYQLQGESERPTIIMWEDQESQKDWALSFQDPDGTSEIWEALRKDPAPSEEKRLLPPPKFANLSDLSRMLTCVPLGQREALAGECMAPKFVAELRESFHTAEDLGSDEALSSLWQIAKGIFLLSSQKLTERYLSQDLYEDVLGMLEYDDGLPADKRIAHRQVMKVKVQFNQPVLFENTEALDKIHLNYRLQYLKDIVLPRLLDDAAFVALTQMIHINMTIILEHLQKDARLIDRLFVQLRQQDLQSLVFLQDACRLAKQIPRGQQQSLYDKLIDSKLYEVLMPYLAPGASPQGATSLLAPRARPRHLAVEIVWLSAHPDVTHLRRHVTGAPEGKALLSTLLRILATEADQGVQGQCADIIRAVMDVAALEPSERDACLDVFYEHGAMDELVAPLRCDACRAEGSHLAFAQQVVCEVLAFAVAQHAFRARVYVVRTGITQQAARLLGSPHRFLQLAPVRFFRSIIRTKDDAYYRYFIKCGLFAPLLKAFNQSLLPPALGGNLLVSSTLELLEFIRIENIKPLVDHLCKKFPAMLQEFAPRFRTIEGLLLKHQQNLEYEAFPPEQHAAGGPIACPGGPARSGRQRSPGRNEDSDDDESYFESLDDDEEEPPPGGGAVDDAPAAASVGAGSGGSSTGAAGGGEPAKDGSASPGLKGLLGSYEDEDECAALPEGGVPSGEPSNDNERALPSSGNAGDAAAGGGAADASGIPAGDRCTAEVGDAAVADADADAEADADADASSAAAVSCDASVDNSSVAADIGREAPAGMNDAPGGQNNGIASVASCPSQVSDTACDDAAVAAEVEENDQAQAAPDEGANRVAAATAAETQPQAQAQVEAQAGVPCGPDEPDEAQEDRAGVAKAKAKASAAGERGLSHAPKRLKTSPPAEV